MNTVLRALAEPRRVEILKLVKKRELAAGQIANRFRVTRPAISQHLRVLVGAGLLHERREGTKRIYRLRPEGLSTLRHFLKGFWDVHLDNLKHAAEHVEGREASRAKR